MSTHTVTQAERIAALEIQVAHLLAESQSMSAKLDELLGLRNRGIGAFWLASALAGTGIVGIAVSLIDWLRGIAHG